MQFPKINRQKLYKLFLILASIVISLAIFYFRNDLAKLSSFGYLGIFVISIVGNATIIIPAPVIAAAFVGGGIFNPYLVGLVTAIGATIGELTGYMAGYGGQAVIEESGNYQKVKGWMEKNGFLTILILATIPNPLFDLAGIVSGVSNYPIWKFLTATVIGKTIKFLFVALLGRFFL